ncbi:MAG: DEAD/DEAH box helicase [Candidatus Nanoarchaeia archaeon]|nr:DEAD/DEAH box helicase [Candidatus Nanoarchaeia archaeon]
MHNLPEIIIKALESKGISELRPPQQSALDKGLMDGKNLVISSPTGSGKTLAAEIAMINHFEKKEKTLYIVPLKSLASEKYKSFKEDYGKCGVGIGLSIGDLDSPDYRIKDCDVVICTAEKADSLIRHDSAFLKSVSCVIIDEIHLIDDYSRGPGLEVLITIMRKLIPKAQFIALSATISNDSELSNWLSAELVKSDYRAVKLYEGVYLNGLLEFNDNKNIEIPCSSFPEKDLALDTFNNKKQLIFFLSSRRNAQSLANRLSVFSDKCLSNKEKGELDILADKVLHSLEQATEQCKSLAECIRKGVAFHHAGLAQKQKDFVEKGFRDRIIKSICATPTLAAGVNLPAFRVIVRDLKRFSALQGSYYIPVLEVKQMFGRAGRPGMEEWGEAITLAKSDSEKQEIFDEYIYGEAENVYSKLSSEPHLRTHVLSLISGNFCKKISELKDFFKETFFAMQYKDLNEINGIIGKIADELIVWGFIEKKGELMACTSIGRRVCELCLDPLVAYNIINSIIRSRSVAPSSFNILQSLCYSGGINLLGIKNNEVMEILSIAENNYLLINEPDSFDFEYDNFLKSVKTAMMFESWINEKSEQTMIDEFKVYPGDLRNLLSSLDWLVYSMQEIGKIMDEKRIMGFLRVMRSRIKYGIKEELFSLVSMKGIGRVRARKLFSNGIRSEKDVLSMEYIKLSELIGPGIAKKIRESKKTF